jgi:hypothetical protein
MAGHRWLDTAVAYHHVELPFPKMTSRGVVEK